MPLRATLAACAFALAGQSHAGSLSVTVVDKDGKPTPDAVVLVYPAAAIVANKITPAPVTVAQEKMAFIPAVSLAIQGTKVRFVNNDAWDHHIRGTAAGVTAFATGGDAAGFELRLDGKPEGKPAKAQEVTMDKAGAVLLGCHLHSSMRGHVYVADTPWALKTDANGVATFADVPNGNASVKLWHADQLLNLPTQNTLLTNAGGKLAFALQVTPRRRR